MDIDLETWIKEWTFFCVSRGSLHEKMNEWVTVFLVFNTLKNLLSIYLPLFKTIRINKSGFLYLS